MRFEDLVYDRPDFDGLVGEISSLLDGLSRSKDREEFFSLHKKIEDSFLKIDELYNIVSIRNSINTKDEFYDGELKLFYEHMPRFDELKHRLGTIRLESKFRSDFEEKYGKTITMRDKLQEDTFDPSIMEDRVSESKLVNEYYKLTGGAEIEFRGEIKNISGLLAITQDRDRDTRREAFEALNGWFAANMESLDRIYDDLVKIRTKIANKLGFETYTPVAYKLMGRLDWDSSDAKKYREQILEHIVPLSQKIYADQAQRIGIENMKYFDLPLSFLSGNPKPIGDEDLLVAKALEMYKELSEETGEFFEAMIDKGMMDLTTKDGKAPGGYMTSLPLTQMPFIFSNFNGTSGDVDVLTHEAGHAFQGYLTRDMYPSENNDLTMEIAETHSMSMEFFTHPWMEKFFGEDSEKYYYDHIASAIKFIPYGASIDEFQEYVYANPSASPKERRAKYREIEKKYLPHLDYDGNEYLENGGRWQRQLHLYTDPFYYIDYTIAQINAFQYFVMDMENHEKAWDSYIKLCKISAKLPTKEALREVGLESPFDDGTIEKILPKLTSYLGSLDKEKIK